MTDALQVPLRSVKKAARNRFGEMFLLLRQTYPRRLFSVRQRGAWFFEDHMVLRITNMHRRGLHLPPRGTNSLKKFTIVSNNWK